MILVVAEDDEFVRDCARSLLESGHRIAAARPRDAKRACDRSPSDLVIVDGQLGELVTDLLETLHQAGRPTIVVMNRSHLDEALAAVEAMAPPDQPRARRA